MIRKIKNAIVLIILGSMIFGQSGGLEAENKTGSQNPFIEIYCSELSDSGGVVR